MLRCYVEVEHRPLERECCQLHEDENAGYTWRCFAPEPLQAGGTGRGVYSALTEVELDHSTRRDSWTPQLNSLGYKWEASHERPTS